jgi:hypothetical protein
VIGGTHQVGDKDTETRADDGAAIMERAVRVLPSLKVNTSKCEDDCIRLSHIGFV